MRKLVTMVALLAMIAGCSDSTGPGSNMPDGDYTVLFEGPNWYAVGDIPGWAAGENRIDIRKRGADFEVLGDSRGVAVRGPALIVQDLDPLWGLHLVAWDSAGWYHVRINADTCARAEVRDHTRDARWSAVRCEVVKR